MMRIYNNSCSFPVPMITNLIPVPMTTSLTRGCLSRCDVMLFITSNSSLMGKRTSNWWICPPNQESWHDFTYEFIENANLWVVYIFLFLTNSWNSLWYKYALVEKFLTQILMFTVKISTEIFIISQQSCEKTKFVKCTSFPGYRSTYICLVCSSAHLTCGKLGDPPTSILHCFVRVYWRQNLVTFLPRERFQDGAHSCKLI